MMGLVIVTDGAACFGYGLLYHHRFTPIPKKYVSSPSCIDTSLCPVDE
jgi:hypothetical protein